VYLGDSNAPTGAAELKLVMKGELSAGGLIVKGSAPLLYNQEGECGQLQCRLGLSPGVFTGEISGAGLVLLEIIEGTVWEKNIQAKVEWDYTLWEAAKPKDYCN
jgi:hypothetical protein